MINPKKTDALRIRMEKLGIKETDITEKFVRASGKGGQKLNKTSSCVFIRHNPTGISVKCNTDRSQSVNRFLARRILTDKIEESIRGEESERLKKIHKLRKQKKRRSRRAKEKILELKKHIAEKKKMRAKTTLYD